MISLTRCIQVNEVTVALYLFAFTKIKQHCLMGRWGRGGIGGGSVIDFYWWIRKPRQISSLQYDEPVQTFPAFTNNRWEL